MLRKNEEELHDKVSEEELMEAKAEKEYDGEAAAEESPRVVKKSTPAKAKEPAVEPAKQDKMEKLPGTKSGMINAAFNAMSKMKKDELAERIKGLLEATHEEDDEEYDDDDEEMKERKKKVKEKKNKSYHKEDFDQKLQSLVDSEATLSEGFKEKAEVIFESAINMKVAERVEALEESYRIELAEEKESIRSELLEQIDSYLNYVVENWVNENELAINNGIRSEISESFMTSLYDVFKEHYVEVPEGKTDLVEELSNRTEEMKKELNSVIKDNISLSEHVKNLNKEKIISESSKELSETQKEKLIELCEDIDFTSEQEFLRKVKILKESYLGGDNSNSTNQQLSNYYINESVEDVETKSVSPAMERYLSALNRNS